MWPILSHFERFYCFQRIKILYFIYYSNTLKQELDGTRSYKETDNDEISVVYAQLNELAVKFSVRVNEGQDKFLRCIGYLSFTKDRIKLDILQILVLGLRLNFLNY